MGIWGLCIVVVLVVMMLVLLVISKKLICFGFFIIHWTDGAAELRQRLQLKARGNSLL